MKRSNSFVNLNVLREEVVTVRSIVENNLVESGCSQFHHVAVVVTAIFVFADHLLAHCQLTHGCLVTLWDRSWVLLLKAHHVKDDTVVIVQETARVNKDKSAKITPLLRLKQYAVSNVYL